MKVLKFGGSSVGKSESIKRVVSIIENYYKAEIPIVVVSSAFQGVTNELILLSKKAVSRDNSYLAALHKLRIRHLNAVEELIAPNKQKSALDYTSELFDQLKSILEGVFLLKELTPRISDTILSFGERLSCGIIAETLNSQEIKCNFVNSTTLIKTDENFSHAKINFPITNKLIEDHFSKNKIIQIVTGFIGSTEHNEISTLGRGGSDYTASILASALKADEIEIWTDVNGIMTADPRRVTDAMSLNAVTYAEAMEMSHFGAKVIYPPTIQPALDKKIKVRIRNTFNPDFKGTVVVEKEPEIGFNAKGISSIDNVTLLNIEGTGMFGNELVTSRIFNALAKSKIKVLLLTQGSSGISISIAVNPQDGLAAAAVIKKEFRLEILDGEIEEVLTEENLSIIAVVGEDMRHTPGISGKVFRSLGKNGVNIIAIAQGSSELNISFVIKESELTKALNVLHDSLFLSEKKILNLFLLGPGLVGSALIQYIKEHKDYAHKELHTKFNLVGIANSKKMIFNSSGLNIEDWKNELETNGVDSNVEKFITEMKKLNMANTIFVDCTASNIAVPHYVSILNSSISIATPNKTANSGTLHDYKLLRQAAKRHNVQFRYGTNVGAALPVITTLQDLINCGEEIISVEGVFSGTLSYLFNSFTGDKKFSEIILEAKANGFTEPDPRDDLNGLDVARKLLILTREIGADLELSDISIENLVPEEARGKDINVEKFYEILKQHDENFSMRKKEAEKKGKVLRYIAKYGKGIAEVRLKEAGPEEAAYSLKGADNVFAIRTKNFFDQPLTISGRGAGATFTASGIYADILRISNYLS
ncbi:MAG: bifunctional aspartate kinase/homoserine dehydrogenase I [Ignavibacteriae bacterium]|nr:bifunctional aspartate kinase/homoserine dehydrogenase I [Ignavibacteriota bacterium]NOG99831.1 bifunctional aspartate kinase/homoserine dehydrogenase I [Ignavibacteriota bacterium]